MNERCCIRIGACAGAILCAAAAVRLAQLAGRTESQAAADSLTLPPPRAVVDAPEHDFGFLDAANSGRHVFLIRNEGGGPLRLRSGGTSCKCTMSHLPKGDIPPGGTAEVELSTKYTATRDGKFRHTARILTNDPGHWIITLTLLGVYRAFLAAKPQRIEFPRPASDDRQPDPPCAEVTLYSQVAVEPRELNFRTVSTDPEFVEVRVAPLKPDSPQLGLYRIEVEVPGHSRMGNFRGVTAGRILIETDHPRLPELSLGLEFAVAGT